jgi:hypothetical protein
MTTVVAIDTAHLQLRPYSPEHMLALIEGFQQFEERSGPRSAGGLRNFLVSDEVSPAWLAQLRASPAVDPEDGLVRRWERIHEPA